MGMLYDAQKAGSPILVTAGQHDQDFNRTEPILYADLPPIARPLVKWSDEVHRLQDLPLMVHRAAKTALAPPTGPVFLSLPGDILQARGRHRPDGADARRAGMRGDRAAIEAAAALLAQAKRPVIMAGDAVAQSRAHAELVALAELIGAPVYAELIAEHGVVPVLASAVPRRDGALAARDAQDLRPARRAVLGRRRPVRALAAVRRRRRSRPDLKMIHLDTDPWELGKNYPAEVAILGDPKGDPARNDRRDARAHAGGAHGAARERLKAASEATPPSCEKLKARRASLAGETPVQPLALIHAIGEILPKDAVVIDEAVSSSGGLRQLVKSDDPQSFFGLRGGGIGWGLPASIGVKLALPDRPVIGLSATAARCTPSRRCGPRRATRSASCS